jgi:hypothetical protein
MRFQAGLGLCASLALATGSYAQTTAPRPAQPPTPTPQTQPQNVQQANSYPTPLYGMPDVSKSLNLNPQQVNQLNQVTNQTQTRHRDNYAKLNGLTPEERYARTHELNRQYNSDWMKGAHDVFNQDQFNRYQQLQYQHGGFASFTDPDMQKRLNMTPEQVKNLRDSIDWSNQQMQTINRQGEGTDREKTTQAYRDYQKQYQDRFNKFLTPEQQKTWREMTGEPYVFQPTLGTQPRP